MKRSFIGEAHGGIVVLNIATRVSKIWRNFRADGQSHFVRNAIELDSYRPKHEKIDKAEFFRFIVKQGRSVSDVNREFAKIAFGPGKLSWEEYVRYQLYDPGSTLSLEDKQNFLSDRYHWKLVAKVSDPTYDALTQDKFLTYNLLSSFGFPVPMTLAVVSAGVRGFPGATKISSADDLKRFVAEADRPLFFKPNTGLGSFAAFICDRSTPEGLMTRPHGQKTPEEVLQLMGRDFLVQGVLENHSSMTPIVNGAVATIRLTNFLIDGSIHSPAAFMKLPGESAIADNFWRPGSMLADLDSETGQIRRVRRGHGISTELLEKHPKSGLPLIGFQIPYWREVLALNESCAFALAPIPFTSLDIAVTDDGPVIVEVNTGGSFDLPQLASGRGIATPEIMRFFGK